MFIQQAFNAEHSWWRYALGIFLVVIATLVGQLPLTAAIFIEVGIEEAATLTEESIYGILDSNLFLFLMLLTFAAGLLALFFVIKFLHEQPILEATTSRPKMDWGRFFFGFGLIAIFSIVVTIIDYFSNPDDYLLNFELVPFLILVVVAVIMIPLQTSFEEYMFRGYLMQGLGVLSRNRWFPLLITSVLFGSLHFFNPEVTKMGNIIMVYYIGTGFLLGIMTLMDEGMELALGFHAGNNLIGVLLVTADWSAFQTNSILKDISEPSAAWDIILPILVVYPIFLFIMAKKYKWTDWKGKLFGRVQRPDQPERLNYSEEI
ncbi:MAG TPA: CPBP family intramembrane glutamic endopeptidase [Salinimicrobium sp.]|nr:CPBP family intramembrane glutamic endopeptidase [Salinimicrobium sp.]